MPGKSMYDKVNPEQMMFLRRAFENKQGEIVAKTAGKVRTGWDINM